METKKEYTNGEVTIVWQPHLCEHFGYCARQMPHVFQPEQRPWIKMNAATTEEIIAQVRKCPSGALSVSPGWSTDRDKR